MMNFKLIIALVQDDKTDDVLDAARQAGATGATLINNARGEGIDPPSTFFGLSLETQRDVMLLLVEEHLGQKILETIKNVAGLDSEPGAGIAFLLNVEEAVGITHQVEKLKQELDEN